MFIEDGDGSARQLAMMGFQPTRTAEEEAYLHLLNGIRTGRYKPGARLIPEEIAAAIGMSRMPVREAFRRLATEGLVAIRPNRGCVVSGLSLAEIDEVFEIRSVLEGLAVRLAMPRIGAPVFAELERLLRFMDDAGNGPDDDWVTHHRRFHEYLCGLSGRPKLMRQIANLHVSIEPYLRIWLHHAEKPRTPADEHRVIIDALRDGDPVRAETAMRMHILETAPLLAAFFNATDRSLDRRSEQGPG